MMRPRSASWWHAAAAGRSSYWSRAAHARRKPRCPRWPANERSLMDEQPRDARAALPAVDRVLNAPGAAALIERYGRSLVLEIVRETLAECRAKGEAASVDTIVAV